MNLNDRSSVVVENESWGTSQCLQGGNGMFKLLAQIFDGWYWLILVAVVAVVVWACRKARLDTLCEWIGPWRGWWYDGRSGTLPNMYWDVVDDYDSRNPSKWCTKIEISADMFSCLPQDWWAGYLMLGDQIEVKIGTLALEHSSRAAVKFAGLIFP